MINENLFTYKCKVVRVIDGDTIEAEIDLGFKISKRTKLRLFEIDTPEIRGAEANLGRAAAAHLISLISTLAANLSYGRLPDDTMAEIWVETVKDSTGKYGRYLATLWGIDPQTDVHINLNKQMVSDGFAKERIR